uniref:DDE Tnp4 domain-containing protein n=1 Tax=Paramormyrops kingsleyae TaxID=1676925 RepID=A0A3B3R9K2_9TELE
MVVLLEATKKTFHHLRKNLNSLLEGTRIMYITKADDEKLRYTCLSTLGFLASGAFQQELADRSGISQSSLNHAMPAVWDGIIPMSGFPNVIGAIDCTHIAIKAPSENEFAYVNRKHFHSINVQIICDAKMRLIHVVFILRNSSVGNKFENGVVLLYFWANIVSFVHDWVSTEDVVECTIGQLKGRWRCLDKTGGVLLYSPEKVCRIVHACSVLHNVAQDRGLPVPEELRNDEPDLFQQMGQRYDFISM